MTHPDLALALEMADAADAISMKWFRTANLPVEAKPDDTPVSIADREVEQAVRALVTARRPDHGVLGEEFGVTPSAGGARWIIDPIDGTKNYVRGVPVWASLIGLEVDGEMALGVVSAPAIGHRWWGVVGEGAWRNGEAIRVSDTATLGDAFLSSDSYTTFAQTGRGAQFDALVAACGRTRGFGDFWSHVLVADGSIDVAVEPEVSLWDLAACAAIVVAAGGRFTNLLGEAGPGGKSAVATNGVLHDAVLAVLNP